jgi:hypothetical protein
MGFDGPYREHEQVGDLGAGQTAGREVDCEPTNVLVGTASRSSIPSAGPWRLITRRRGLAVSPLRT